MKAVILAGGYGSRLSEETVLKPKPMVEIGGHPILWHIMKIYAYYGINDFIICCGYKGHIIKEYFSNYFIYKSAITFDMKTNKMQVHDNRCEPWTVTLVDTGKDTMTGGRLKRVKKYINNETFCFTYGDGVSDININKLITFHKNHGLLATITAVNPSGRYGSLELIGDKVVGFREKPQSEDSWINGGFFVLEPSIFDFIENDDTSFENYPLEHLASIGQLIAYKHRGFWLPMDTLRDKNKLNELWESNKALWKVW